MIDLVEELKEEAVKVSIERGGDRVSSRDATGSVIWQAALELERVRAWGLEVQTGYIETRQELELLRASVTKTEALAIEVLQELSDEAEKFVDRLTAQWTSDLGATPETKAAGFSSHLINDFRGHIGAALIKLERRS
jgi:hypothetical protein